MDADLSVQTRTQLMPGHLLSHEQRQPKAPLVVKILALLVPPISLAARYWVVIIVALLGEKIHSVQIAEMVGALIGVFLVPLIVVLLFQIGKRFRNPRSRWSIYLYVNLFLLVSTIFSVFTEA